MANKSDIELELNTKYKGDGITKLKQGVRDADSTIKKASGAINQINSQLGSLNNAAGKAATAVTGLANSFALGGIWGAAAAGAMMVVNLIVDGFQKAKQEAEEAAKKTKEAFIKSIDSIKDAFAKVKEDFQFQITTNQNQTNTENIVRNAAYREYDIKRHKQGLLERTAEGVTEELIKESQKREANDLKVAKLNREQELGVRKLEQNATEINIQRGAYKESERLYKEAEDKTNDIRFKREIEMEGMLLSGKTQEEINKKLDEYDELLKKAVEVQEELNKKRIEEAAKLNKLEQERKDLYYQFGDSGYQDRLAILGLEEKEQEQKEQREKAKKAEEETKKTREQIQQMVKEDYLADIDKTYKNRFNKDSSPYEIKAAQDDLQQSIDANRADYQKALEANDVEAAKKSKEIIKTLEQQLKYLNDIEKAANDEAKQAEEKAKIEAEAKKKTQERLDKLTQQNQNDTTLKNLKEEQVLLQKQHNEMMKKTNMMNGVSTYGDYLKAEKEANKSAKNQMEKNIKKVMIGGSDAANIIGNNLSDEDRARLEAELNKLGPQRKADSKWTKDRRDSIQALLDADQNKKIKDKEQQIKKEQERQQQQKMSDNIAELVKLLGGTAK